MNLFSFKYYLFQQQQKITLLSDGINFLNNVAEMYISVDRKSIFYPFFHVKKYNMTIGKDFTV